MKTWASCVALASICASVVFADAQEAATDYTQYEPGANTTSDLRDRFELIELVARALEDGQLIGQLYAARDDLQQAIESGDREHAGRVLTYLESLLGEHALEAAALSRKAAAHVESGRGEALHERLRLAQAREDEPAIHRIVADFKSFLGEYAGIPEVPDRRVAVSPTARELSKTEAQTAVYEYVMRYRDRAVWHIGEDPEQNRHMLRAPAGLILACVAAYRAGSDHSDRLLKFAEETAAYLMWTQEQAEAGLFPFPARRGTTEGVFGIADRALKQAEANGRLDEVVRNGWFIEDKGLDDGGLQFDNGLCGVALLELYEATNNKTYLDSALQSADWALSRPCVPNWNYNSFSIYLLAEAYRVSGNQTYREAAKRKARLGVIPGQLRDGPRQGRWADPHNARPAYHFIMIRGLTSLLAILDDSDPDREALVKALRLALEARVPEIVALGVNNTDSTLDALTFLHRRLPEHRQILGDFQQDSALKLLGRYCSDHFRETGDPIAGPAAWGRYVEHVLKR